MRRSRRTAVVLCTLLLAGVLAGCTSRDIAEQACLDGSHPIVVSPTKSTVRWPSSLLLLANGTTIDARNSTFTNNALDSAGYSVAIKFHYKADSRHDLCLVGGHVSTNFDPETTTWSTFHKIYGLAIETPGITIVGTTIYNEGDGFIFGPLATDWELIGVAAEGPPGSPGAYIHDDCVENDAMHSGRIDDSKFDGCNVFLSSNPGGPSTVDASAETVEVTNSLVRLQPMQESFDPAKYGYNQHGGFFKWAAGPTQGGIPPQLVVRNLIFRADQQGLYGGNANGFLALPPGTVCDNVTLVGTAVWDADDLASWTSQCTNLTLGTVAQWDAAVAQWDADHPDM